jgi:hypothetical protein
VVTIDKLRLAAQIDDTCDDNQDAHEGKQQKAPFPLQQENPAVKKCTQDADHDHGDVADAF